MMIGSHSSSSIGISNFDVLVLFVACAGVVSCGGVEPGGQAVDDVVVETEIDSSNPPLESWVYNTCSLETRVGGFEVTLAEDYTGVNGQVLAGVVPVNVPEIIEDDGSCKLLKTRVLYCEPGCVPGETCGEAGACIPYPEALSVGTVVVTGLKTTQTMEAKWGEHYTNSGSLEHPAFETNASLHLSAAGGDAEPFELEGVGVAPLEMSPGSEEVTGMDGEGIALQWDVGPLQDGVRVQIELNINNHGSTNAWVACEVDDTGAYTISADLISNLYGFGVSGFPSLSVTRQSADSVDLSFGCVDFLVASERMLSIEFAGVTSCTSDVQCPPGQSCGADLQCH